MRSINRNQQNEGQRITEHKPAAHIYIGREQVEMERWKEIVTSRWEGKKTEERPATD
jgi:hypothetical protein